MNAYLYKLGIITLAILLSTPIAADSITLRRSVRLPANQTQLTLADIATLDGEAAVAMGDTVVFDLADVAESATSVNEIKLATIRKRLTERGVHWGKVHLSGRDVLVRPVGGSSRLATESNAATPLAMQPVSLDSPQVSSTSKSLINTVLASKLIDEPTLRGVITRRIANTLNARPEQLRLEFKASQTELLATDTQTYQIELEPLSELTSDQVEIAVRFWQDGNIAQNQRISVKPMLQRPVLRMTSSRRRGERIRQQDVSTTIEWQTPSSARLFDTSPALINQIAVRNLREGDLLRPRDLQPERVIKRGDRVKVRCLSGGVVIALEAEARGDAGIGEEVELKRFGERDTFYATVSAPGEATIDVQRTRRSQHVVRPSPPNTQTLQPMWKE